jgi:hypothetical protein
MKPFATLLLLALLALPGCAAADTELTADEATLVRATGVDPAIARHARTQGVGLARWQGQTADFNPITAAGIVVLTERQQGEAVTRHLRKRLADTAYHAYLREQNFGHQPDEVVVTALDEAGYLAMARPDAINYGMDHDALMKHLAPWRQRYGLRLFGAGGDWMQFDITQPPADWLAFAHEVYELCPDVVDQGTGDVASLAREMEAARTLYLWWD